MIDIQQKKKECQRCKTEHRWRIREPKRCRHCGIDWESERIMKDAVRKYGAALRRLADK